MSYLTFSMVNFTVVSKRVFERLGLFFLLFFWKIRVTSLSVSRSRRGGNYVPRSGMFIWLVYWFSGREWAAGRNKYLQEFWHLPRLFLFFQNSNFFRSSSSHFLFYVPLKNRDRPRFAYMYTPSIRITRNSVLIIVVEFWHVVVDVRDELVLFSNRRSDFRSLSRF